MANEAEVAQGECGPACLPLPRLLRTYWRWTAASFVLMLLVALAEWKAGMEFLRWYPGARPFMDLYQYPKTYALLHTRGFFSSVPTPSNPAPELVAYPPFAAAVMAPLYAAAKPVAVYLAVAILWIATAVWGVRCALMRRGIGALTATLFPASVVVLTFPILRMVHEGNIELVLWMFAALGTWVFLSGHDNWAAALWGLAAAMKLYPLVLLMLLLPRGRWKAILLGVGTFVGATVWALWWIGPSMSVAWHGSLKGVFGYQGLRVDELSLRELSANHSIFALVKVPAIVLHIPLERLTLPYYAVGVVVMLAVFFGRLWKMPVANQLLAVSVFMVSLPTVSYFHTLANLYLPLVVLWLVAIDAGKTGVKVPGLAAAVMMFVPLFASWTLFTFQRVFLFDGMVQAVLLAGLFLCAAEYPFAAGAEGKKGLDL